MPSPLSLLQDHTTLRCRSLDRLYLNAYIPELQRPETVKRFLEREATPIASPALFRQRSERFITDLRAYAEARGAPWLTFERGERKEEKEVKEDDFYKAECFYGSFYRRLPLGFDVPADKVNAKFADGVLEVRLPMPVIEKEAPKEIPIN